MVKPKVQARSSRVSDRPAFGFGASSFGGGFATVTSPLSYLTELPDTSKISDPHTVVIFKNLFKRDSTTKAKALEELQNLLSPSTGDTPVVEDAVLDIWVAVYPRTSIDSTRRVRLLAQTVQGLISAAVGKSLAKHMPKLAGPWLLGSYDTDKSVAIATQSAIAQLFTPEKLLALRKVYQSQILETCIEIIEKENPKTLSDERVITPEESIAKYDRVVAGALGLMGSLLNNLTADDRKKEAAKYTELLTDKTLWALVASEDGFVRRAINQLLRTTLEQVVVNTVLDAKTLSASYVEKGLKSDQSGTASDLVRSLTLLTRLMPKVWTQGWTAKKAPYTRIRDFLKPGTRGASATYWREVSTLLELIPKEAHPSIGNEAQKLLEAYHQGVTGKSELKTYLKPGTLGYLQAVPYVTANISDNDEYLTVLSETVLPIIESFVLFGPDSKWHIALEWGSQIVRQALEIKGVLPILTHQWNRITDSLIDQLKLSLPETSKDYKVSQDTVKESGLRWALAVKEIFTVALDENIFKNSVLALLRESLHLCESRNGKPYGAAVTVQVLLKYVSTYIWRSEEGAGLLDNFICESLPRIFISPSTSALSTILLAARDRDYFENTWSACLMKVVSAEDSPAKTSAFTELLGIAKQTGSATILKNAAVDALIDSQVTTAISEGSNWKSLAGILAVVDDEKANDTLATLVSKLYLDNQEASNTVQGLSIIGESEPKLLETFVASVKGQDLLSSVLRLTEARDDEMALAATDLNTLLHRSSNVPLGKDRSTNKQNRMIEVIKKGLDTASISSVSVDTLISQAHNILTAKEKATTNSLLPNTTIWKTELTEFLRVSPHLVLDTMETIPGIVYTIDRVELSREQSQKIPRDSEGLSIPLRMALYTVKLFEVADLPEIDPETMADIVQLLLLTTTLINNNLSIDGCNNIWIAQGPLVDNDIVEYLSASQHLISSWVLKSGGWWLEDQKNSYNVIEDSMRRLFDASKGQSPMAYYSSKAYEHLITQLVSKHGLSQRRLAEIPSTLATLRRSEELLQAAAFITGHSDFISNIPVTKNWYNAIVAEATSLKYTEQRAKSLRQLCFLNIFLATMGDSFIATAAHQRLVFLFRDTIAGLEATNSDPALQSLMLSILRALCAPLASVYGEYWETVIAFIKDLWLSMTSLSTKDSEAVKLNLLHESQRLFRTLKRLTKSEDCNEDLSEALSSSLTDLHRGLLNVLCLDMEHPDEFHQPLRIVRAFVANELSTSSIDLKFAPELLYPIINAQNEAVQSCAFELLHKRIPELQEQISLDVAIEKETVSIPDELVSLILEAPQAKAIKNLEELGTQLILKRYLYAWVLVFDHFTNASHQLQSIYLENIKEGGYLADLLDLTFDMLGHSKGAPIKTLPFDLTTFGAGLSESPRHEIQWLLCHLYYLSLVHLSSLAKNWWMHSKRTTAHNVESWTEKHVTPPVVATALTEVNEWSKLQESGTDPEDRPLFVKVNIAGGEVFASYTIGGEDDERSLSISVKLPSTFPLHPAQVLSRSTTSTFEEKRWRSWLMSAQGVINFSNNSIPDGLLAWRRNVAGALQGKSECTICYSLVSEDGKLPNKTCTTCKHAFHMLCLTKWFASSGDKKCPLCRSDFVGLGRVERTGKRGADRDA